MKQLGPYELLEELARGGMGTVHRARDTTGRELALKLLQPGVDDARFEQEAEAAARLRHPGIVTVHAFARHAGRPYLVMELVPGRPLAAHLRDEGPLPPTLALDLALQLCEALAHAHTEGVLHRDLKPQNVILQPDGRVKLADFGLARVEDQSRRLTQTGELLGTPAYMPPEQIEGKLARLGPASDVYGLGATLYAMLCGRAPFVGASPVNVLNAALRRPPDPFAEHGVDVPADLERVVRRCLEKDPGRRYATVEALALDLRSLRDGGSLAGGRSPSRTASAIAVLGLTLFAAAALAWRTAPPPPVEPASSPAPAAQAPSQPDQLARLLSMDDGSERLRAIHAYLGAHPERRDVELGQLYQRLAREFPLDAIDLGLGQKVFVAAHHDDVALVTDEGQATLWTPLLAPRPLESPHLQKLTAAALSPDAVWVSADGVLHAIDRSPTRRVPRPQLFEGTPVGVLACSPDGRRLAVEQRLGETYSVIEYDLSSGEALVRHTTSKTVQLRALAYAPDGEHLAGIGKLVDSEGAWLLIWPRGPSPPHETQLPYPSERVRFGAQSQRIAVGSKAGHLREYACSGEELRAYQGPMPADDWRGPRAHLGQIRGLAYTLDGELLYSLSKQGTSAPDHELRVWETATQRLLEVRPLAHEPADAVLSRDGTLLLVGTQDGRAEAWLLVDPR